MTPPGAVPARGPFITIEGPEGSGKTTQAARLAADLRARGHEVVEIREPGGTALGEQLRAMLLARRDGAAVDPLADAYLFNAARRQLTTEVLGPALARGAIVVAARFTDSTLAYQGFGAGVPLADLETLARLATDGLRPDRTILLDLPVEVGLGRKTGGERTRFEHDYDLAFHRRVRDGFLRLAADDPGRFAVVDATGSPDDVAAAIRAAVEPLVPGRAAAGEPNRPAERIPG